jgi:hypothetical protein
MDETEGTSGGAAPLSRDAQLAADRAAFLADDIDGEEETAPAKPAPKKPAPAAESDDEENLDDEDDADEDDAETVDEDEDDLDDEDEENDDEDDLEDEDEPGKDSDPETEKRLAKVRKTAQRQREALERDRAAFKAEHEKVISELKPKFEALERFEKLKSRVRYEPAEVLFELGLTEDDAEDAARAIFARSKKGAEDPKNKDAVARSRREREQADKIANLEKKLEEREAKDSEAAKQAEGMKRVERYMRKVEKNVTDEHPLTKAALTKAPKRTRAGLEQVAAELARKANGSFVSPAKVARVYEARRLKEARAMGLEVPSGKAAAKTEPKTGEKTTAGAKGKPAPAAKPTEGADDDDRVWSRKEILAAMPD